MGPSECQEPGDTRGASPHEQQPVTLRRLGGVEQQPRGRGERPAHVLQHAGEARHDHQGDHGDRHGADRQQQHGIGECRADPRFQVGPSLELLGRLRQGRVQAHPMLAGPHQSHAHRGKQCALRLHRAGQRRAFAHAVTHPPDSVGQGSGDQLRGGLQRPSQGHARGGQRREASKHGRGGARARPPAPRHRR